MRIFSVSELTGHIKQRLEADYYLSNVWVRGEISNFRQPSSGHMYFILKDLGSCIRAVMFRSRSLALPFIPADGMKVIARGYVTVYERDGLYQLYVEEIQPDGVGTLHLAFEQLKEKLAQEGLFDPERKKPIPPFPEKIGIVTSLTGAVLRDILTVLDRRFPDLHLVIAPAAVQGYHAPMEIARAISNLNTIEGLDLIIVARGGGSLEELWAFNTETVARAIAGSRVPVISAVGHETDYTIADFVADLRAPTPSAAAEMIVPLQEELVGKIAFLESRLERAMLNYLDRSRRQVEQLAGSQAFYFTMESMRKFRQQVEDLAKALTGNIIGLWRGKYYELTRLGGRLAALNPLATLERGYALCLDRASGRLISSARRVSPGSGVRILLRDGELHCLVQAVEEGNHEKES